MTDLLDLLRRCHERAERAPMYSQSWQNACGDLLDLIPDLITALEERERLRAEVERLKLFITDMEWHEDIEFANKATGYRNQ